ncbi:MAG: hypothetical protein KAJ19_12100, partial [Gammaproteobacteria bacterium]|nr:hypothetical protein [Gammaproteobacteria bacterium]
IGTYHPAAILRKYSNRPTALTDLRRIKNESLVPTISLPEREFIIQPDYNEVMNYLSDAMHADWVSVDIEVQWYKYISCIGFSFDPKHAISVPYILNTQGYWSNDHYWKIKKAVNEVLKTKPIVGQNFHFDWCWLRADGYEINNLWFDTMQAHHAAWPELPRSLAYMASIYTRQPFWKDMAKEADPDNKMHTHVKDYEKYWTYNCLDAAVTGELVTSLQNEIDAVGQRETFEHEMSLIPDFVDLTMRGFGFDKELRNKLRSDCKKRLKGYNKTIDDQLPGSWHCKTCKGVGHQRKQSKTQKQVPHAKTLCPDCKTKLPGERKFSAPGCELCKGTGKKQVMKLVMEDRKCPDCKGGKKHINPDSPAQLKTLLYDVMKMPEQHKKGMNRTVTSDRDALLKLQVKYPKREVLQTLLDYSEVAQEESSLKAKLGADGRMHTSLASNTNTGRLSSSSDPFGRGTNQQNIKRHGEFRKMYRADPGFVLMAGDYEKAEAYAMGYEANDAVYLDALENCGLCRGRTGIVDPNCPRCKGTGRGDIHTKNATIIFEKPWESIIKDERQLGKRACHGLNYCMGAPTLVDYVLKEMGAKYAITQRQAREFRELYFRTYTGLLTFQEFVEAEIKRCRIIWNSWGRRHEFIGRPDAKTCREGVAFVPQSTV